MGFYPFLSGFSVVQVKRYARYESLPASLPVIHVVLVL